MKNILSYLLIACFFTLTCCAQGDKKKTGETKEQRADTIKGPAIVTIPEKPIGWVSDFEKLFTPEQIIFLDSIIAKHEKETANEVAIVTYGMAPGELEELGGLESFSFALFNKWGIGKKEKNNGIGILIMKDERKIRIEVGQGLDDKLTDEEAKAIIDTIMIPEFKKENYYAGVLKGLHAVFTEIQ
jgi:uncharacterized protein